ncbi:hypothetical protein [Enterovibrio norvegicus]|uniref:Uncharacterized protein n=1 Tax=Enterovibrio norvegicus TaxID=188144 RepID=A0A2N7L8P7_9GAMM|nr:hypothetical protein [Enterovibrio norvegicus]PMN90678.1 hypothetical protein BCT23_04110 [Enterovibrio norvegicus]
MSECRNTQVSDELRSYTGLDESIHSFLLRTQLSHDSNAKPIGVITPQGKWAHFPFVNKELSHLFRRFADHQLLEAIDVSKSIDGRYNALFDSPDFYVDRIKSTFFDDRESLGLEKNTANIRYCLDCVSEGIEQIGYGYFRHFWSVSNTCLVHGRPLKQLPNLGFNKALKAVKAILRGKNVKSAITLPEASYRPTDLHRGAAWYQTGKYFFPIKAASCLKQSFSLWIGRNLSQFRNQDLRSSAQYAVPHYLNNTDQVRELDLRKALACIHLLCASLEPDLLREFYISNVDYIGLELGPRKQGVLREVYSKKKGAECKTCSFEYCSMKQTTTTTFSVCPSELDFEYLLNNSYSLARIAMQGRPIATLGKDAWSPINVQVQAENGEKPELYKVQLNEPRLDSELIDTAL